MGTPARGYCWPPFGPENPGQPAPVGNARAEKHGAHMDRRWRPIADRLAADLATVAPWCARPVYAVAVMAWARVEAQLSLVSTWLDANGPLDADGVPRPATTPAARLETQAQGLRAELGLSPSALAKLTAAFGQAVAAGGDDDGALDKLKAEGRRIVDARAAQLADPDENRRPNMTDEEILNTIQRAVDDTVDAVWAAVWAELNERTTVIAEALVGLAAAYERLDQQSASLGELVKATERTSTPPPLGEITVRLESGPSTPTTRRIDRDAAGNISAIREEPVTATGPTRWTPDRPG